MHRSQGTRERACRVTGGLSVRTHFSYIVHLCLARKRRSVNSFTHSHFRTFVTSRAHGPESRSVRVVRFVASSWFASLRGDHFIVVRCARRRIAARAPQTRPAIGEGIAGKSSSSFLCSVNFTHLHTERLTQFFAQCCSSNFQTCFASQ